MKFNKVINVLESNLRRASEQSFLFEEISTSYKSEMIDIFNKAIKDELHAAGLYQLIAGKIQDSFKARDEIQQHGIEEYEHFTQLVKYATNHGIIESLNLTLSLDTENMPSSVSDIIAYTQELETQAFTDYKNAAQLADEVGDSETRMFFEELMKDELRHFDDLGDLDARYVRNFDEF